VDTFDRHLIRWLLDHTEDLFGAFRISANGADRLPLLKHSLTQVVSV
jgi:hypothetical protein